MGFGERIRTRFAELFTKRNGEPKKFILLNEKGNLFVGTTRVDKDGAEIGAFTSAINASYFREDGRSLELAADSMNISVEELKDKLSSHNTIYY